MVQTVFYESLREAAGVSWGHPPALCQHSAHRDSAWLGFFQNQNLLSRPTFREPCLDVKVYRYKNWHRAMNCCEFGWLGVLGMLKIPMCWGVGLSHSPAWAQGVPRAQAGRCMSHWTVTQRSGRERWVCVSLTTNMVKELRYCERGTVHGKNEWQLMEQHK